MTSWNTTFASVPRVKTKTSFVHADTFNALLIAGVLGGLAEILWVALYAQLSPLNATEVARQITASVIPAMTDAALAPWLGVVIHFVLSILLAFFFGAFIWRPITRKHAAGYTAIAAALFLIFVWTINFFIILPRLNPVFVTLMPYSVTFFSKLLFGLMAGAWLCHFQKNLDVSQIN